jgi:hypothetical protein
MQRAMLRSCEQKQAHIQAIFRRCQSQRATSVGLSLIVRLRGGMLNVHEISNAGRDVRDGRMSVEDFERWLRRRSRNVHAWGDAELVSAVLAVESVLSDFRFDGLAEEQVAEQLENAVRPFAQTAHVRSVPERKTPVLERITKVVGDKARAHFSATAVIMRQIEVSVRVS